MLCVKIKKASKVTEEVTQPVVLEEPSVLVLPQRMSLFVTKLLETVCFSYFSQPKPLLGLLGPVSKNKYEIIKTSVFYLKPLLTKAL